MLDYPGASSLQTTVLTPICVQTIITQGKIRLLDILEQGDRWRVSRKLIRLQDSPHRGVYQRAAFLRNIYCRKRGEAKLEFERNR